MSKKYVAAEQLLRATEH